MFDWSSLDGIDFEGFDPSEVRSIVTNYVCSHCYATLVPFQVPNDRIYIIACSECGVSIEQIGAVSKNTVSIRYEQANREFKRVITNLKDLYPSIQHMSAIQHTPLREGETETGRNVRELGF